MPSTIGRHVWFWLIAGLLGAGAMTVWVVQPSNRPPMVWSLVVGVVAPLVAALITRRDVQPSWELADAQRQLRRVAAYVPFIVPALFLIVPIRDAPFVSAKLSWVLSEAIYLLVFVGVPLLLLHFRIWMWPRIPQRIGVRRVSVVAAFATALLGLSGFAWGARPGVDPSAAIIGVALLDTLVGAIGEEVIFRVMLLSYLCAVLRSPLSAVAISALAFSAVHVPFDVLDAPQGEPFYRELAVLVALPVWRAAIGIFLGVLWLRTRSLALIGVAHALQNMFWAINDTARVWS